MRIAARLTELAHAVADGDWDEFSMRVPAEPDRDADLVLLAAAKEITRLRAELADLRDACAEKQRCIDSSVAAQRAFLAEIDALRAELVDATAYEDGYVRDLQARDEEITRLMSELAECQRLLHRYRNETPLGHQPHMIAHEVDAALAADRENNDGNA